MEKLWKELESQAGGELPGLLDNMFDQLLSKDVLYEPMKELCAKFPAWLQKHRSTLTAADLMRHERQLTCVREIVAAYETNSTINAEAMTQIALHMQTIQENGNLPEELLNDMNIPAGDDILGGKSSEDAAPNCGMM